LKIVAVKEPENAGIQVYDVYFIDCAASTGCGRGFGADIRNIPVWLSIIEAG
jgi:hypothetical protein